MLISIVILLFFVLIYIVRYTNSKYSMAFIWFLAGATCILIANVFYITRFENYRIMFSLESPVYDVLKNLKLKMSDIRYLVILGMIIAAAAFWKISFVVVGKAGKCVMLAALIVSSIMFVFLNSQDFCEKLYILNYTDEEFWRSYTTVCNMISAYNYMYIIIPSAATVFLHTKALINSRIDICRRRFLLLIISAAISIVCFIYLLHGTPAAVYMKPENINNFYLNTSYKESEYLVYLAIGFLCFTMYAVLGKASIFSRTNIWDRILNKRKERMMISDIRHIFHAYKNSMFTILSLQMQALEYYNQEKGKEALKKIEVVVYSFTERVQMIWKTFNGREFFKTSNDICECISEAVESINIPAEINTEIICSTEETQVWCDRQSIIEMLVNIINNSVDAILEKKNTDGKISIFVFSENELLCVEIKDNGIGMTKSEMKNIFKLLVSSKRTHKNWGIGLAYAYMVAKGHNGEITVKSRKNDFTSFQITMRTDNI